MGLYFGVKDLKEQLPSIHRKTGLKEMKGRRTFHPYYRSYYRRLYTGTSIELLCSAYDFYHHDSHTQDGMVDNLQKETRRKYTLFMSWKRYIRSLKIECIRWQWITKENIRRTKLGLPLRIYKDLKDTHSWLKELHIWQTLTSTKVYVSYCRINKGVTLGITSVDMTHQLMLFPT